MNDGKIINPPRYSVIGAGVIDILAGPVSESVFVSGSEPMETIKSSFGGDALNEAVVLSRLGRQVSLVSKVGSDQAGKQVKAFLKNNGVDTRCVREEEGLETGINIVLVGGDGERYFLTNPNSSLRMLSREDILPRIRDMGQIVSFASMFVSRKLGVPEMEEVFEEIRRSGRTLCADMTTAKRGETIDDLKGLLPHLDVLFGNEKEASLLTGQDNAQESARAFVRAGVSCAVIKLGRRGSLIQTATECLEIPPYLVQQPLDSTGAGDCFAAGFLWGMGEGFSWQDCGRFASAVSSCCVERFGATEGITSQEEIRYRFEILRNKI